MTTRRPRPLRGAIVGFGNVAVEGHLPAWRANRQFSIAAVCDASDARLALAAELLPSARRYTTLEALLQAEKLDFVDVATPPATHAPIVLEVLAKRLHVLCEKPLTTHWDEYRAIKSAATARAIVFTTHNWKYAPIFRTAKRTLRRGDIGAVSHVRLETIRTTPPGDAADTGTWRLDPAQAGGGIMVDHGWHAFYLARHLVDAEPLAISAITTQRKFVTAGVEDTAECTIDFANGARAEILLTWAGDARRNSGTVTGALGSLAIADRTLVTTIGERSPAETHFAQPLSGGSYHPDWFAAMLDDFHAEVHDPGVRGENAREAEACCRLIEWGYRSSALGGARLVLADPLPPAGPPSDSGA